MQFMWQRRDKFLIGRHTTAICDRIDQAIKDYRNGISTYLQIKVPFRHGKSDMVSRYLPANFIGQFPDQEVLVAGYTASLTRGFSRACRSIVRDSRYEIVYPDISLSKDEQSIEAWAVHDRSVEGADLGRAYWEGLGGSITGKGGALILIDDFFKNREEAESEVMRNKVWDSITNDILTRCAPVVIFIILATPWHVDDPFGRISQKMAENPDFPRFQEVVFPALGKMAGREYETLFPERFSKQWYTSEAAILGTYGTASLLQCNPTLRSGNQLRTDKMQYYTELPKGIPLTRGWDLASSEAQRISDNPDYTASIRLGVKWLPTAVDDEHVPILYIDDFTIGRYEARKRNKIIRDTAIADGTIKLGIEDFGAYKDAATTLKDVLKGLRAVHGVHLPGDKVTKADAIEPAFEAGNVFMRRASWNQMLLQFLQEFPGGAHEDPVDALIVAFALHRPFDSRIWAAATAETLAYAIKWHGTGFTPTLHYASIYQHTDLSMWIIGALWDDVKGRLFVYDAWCIENPVPVTVVEQMVKRLRLNKYAMERILVSDKMSKPSQEYKHSVAKLINKELAREPKVRVRLREPIHYDPMGAVFEVGQLYEDNKMIMHTRAAEAALQNADWSIVKGKPEKNNCGYCHALCQVVSELRRRNLTKKRVAKVRDYTKVKPKTQGVA